jgi:microcystin-dependent protein
MANTQQGFPQLSMAIADITNGGRVTQPWLQFFISLWNRTGATEGGATFNSGDLKPIAGNTIPGGWLLCDGSLVSRTQYTALFNAIGTIWGAGDNVTTFGLPNGQGATFIGASMSFPLGSSGGSATTTLAIPNLPVHNHAINDPGHTHTVTDPGHVHTTNAAASNSTTGSNPGGGTPGNTGSAVTGITNQTSTTGITTATTGTGTPVSTISPYFAGQWIIKT